jgi:hypothetical protein
LSFANNGLDGIILGNIPHHKSLKSKIPPYFKDQSEPIISYVYTRPIASIFFYFKFKPPHCTCTGSPLIYNPTGHFMTGDLKIINNTSLEMFAKGPKYREPKSIYWKHNFQILMIPSRT